MFAGHRDGNTAPNNQTWAWKDGVWTQRFPSVAPTSRFLMDIEFDAAREEIVVFGGQDTSGVVLDDTWLWNGSNWAQHMGQSSRNQIFDMTANPTGVWNYTTIDLPARITVKFKKNDENTPVVWLATGEVNIGGVLDLNGAAGGPVQAPGNEAPSGPGGFAGGVGGVRESISGTFAGTPGQGPGGGGAPIGEGTQLGTEVMQRKVRVIPVTPTATLFFSRFLEDLEAAVGVQGLLRTVETEEAVAGPS